MTKLQKSEIEDILSLTPMQEGMLFYYLREPQSQRYFEQISLNISGPIDNRLFEEAWNAVVASNEMLRTLLRWEKLDKPTQVILKKHSCKIIFQDLSHGNHGSNDTLVQELRNRDRQNPFDLRRVPFRITLCKLAEDRYEMILSNHHIIYDGWSSGVLLKEFFEAYRKLCGGDKVVPLRKPYFKEFLRCIGNQDKAKQGTFWDTYLKDSGPLAVHRNYIKENRIKDTANLKVSFPKHLKTELDTLVKDLNITTASFLYSTWGLLLQHYNRTRDVVFHTTTSGRSAKIKGIEHMVGLFINTLPLRVKTQAGVQTDCNTGETVRTFLSRMHRELNQWSQYENSSPSMVREIMAKYDYETLFDSVMVIENYPLDRLSETETAPLIIRSFSTFETTNYDLTIIVTLFDRIEFNITYNKKLFSSASVSGIFRYLQTIIQEMTHNPGKTLQEIKALPGEQIDTLRRKIHAAQDAVPSTEGQYVAPRNAIEGQLVEIWSEVLHIPADKIGIHHNFFDFGGHSFKASLLAARIHRVFAVKIPLVAVFQRPSIQELAEYIGTAKKEKYIPIPVSETKEYYVVSAAQKRMYMLHRLNPGSLAYNGPWVVKLEGSPDEKRLSESFKGLIKRHEILRTSFRQREGEAVQQIHPQVDFQLQPITAIEDFIQPFDLSKAPLMRAGIMKTGEHVCFLVVDMHHIITDGTSTAVLTRELAGLYNGEDLPSPGVQYKDFCQWQQERIQQGALKKQEEYWLQHLAGELPVLDLPYDFPRPRVQSFAGERIQCVLSHPLTHQIHQLTKETGTTLYMVLMATFNVLLSCYGRREDIVLGTPVSGRNHGDLENTVGLFLETQAIRCQPEGKKTFGTFLNEVKHTALQANENQDYPFDRLISQLVPVKDLSRNPLFDVMVNVLNQTGIHFELEGVTCSPYPMDWKVAKVDLTLEAIEDEGEIKLELEYSTALFKRETAQRIVNSFLKVLRQVVFTPQSCLTKIEIIDEKEKRQILEEFNNTAFQYDTRKTVVHYFEQQVEKTPDRIALLGTEAGERAGVASTILGNIAVTYRELNNRSNRLARMVRAQGLIPGSIVAIMVERSIELVTCLMGILKAGGAYLPIDLQFPEERIDYMLKDSAVRLLIHTGAPGISFQAEINTINIDTLDTQSPRNHSVETRHREFPFPQPGDRAYVIYTSGSTGKPRGVVVKHSNLMAYIRAFRQEFTVSDTDIVLQQASFSFDVFVEEVYPCLLAGGALALPPRHVIRDTSLLVDYIGRHHIGIVDCSPLLLNELNRWVRDNESNPLKSIHTFISGGDVLKGEYVEELLKCGSIYNTYGPTETTVCASYYRVTAKEGPAVPIGKPIGNYRVYILDSHRRVLPLGVAGEICIGGVGVSAGYLNHPQLTAEKFIPAPAGINDPDSLSPEKRNETIYLTGDLGKWHPNGNIEFLGRVDRQVKIRGFRIEPAEIETQLLTHKDILEAVVASDGSQAICAYFTASREKSVHELREFLSRNLPNYMIPAFFVQLPRIPQGPTGKVDMKALPKPGLSGLATGAIYEPPQNDLQEKLAEMWQELLGRGNIGILDDFFDLGGDSIQVNRCVAMIRNAFSVDISLLNFFEQPYIKSLAQEIQKELNRISGVSLQPEMSIPPAERTGAIPLSFPQERLWFLQNLDQANVSYFVPRVVRIQGNLEPRLLERTFSEIIRRHEILRTVFITRDGVTVQEVREPFNFKIPVIPLKPGEVESWLNRESRKAFDFEIGPLLRVTLLKQEECEHLLVLTEHHLVHDGWTQGVLLKEFIAIFSAYREGRNHDLPALPIQYADFALWQHNFLKGPRLEKHLDYWQEKLKDMVPLLELPVDYPRPPVISGYGAMKELHISGKISARLDTFCRDHNVTLFMVMLAAFKILLHRYSGEEDLCVGTGIANRGYKEMEGMLGMVINTLPLRTRTVGHLTVSTYLNQVKTTCIEAYQHQDAPFGKIVEALAPERSLGYNPLFQVMFSFMDTPTEDLWLPGLELHLEPLHNRSSKFDITIVVVPPPERSNGEILVEWEYNTDVFADSTMERMLNHYYRLIQEIIITPEEKISTLPLLSNEELDRLLYEWNNMGIPYPREKTLHQLFTEQVEKNPDYIALTGPGTQNKSHRFSLTYKELNTRSGKLARRLKESSIGTGTITAIIAERSIEVMIGILAILKSGSAYLPIDPDYPPDRIRYMLKDSAAVALLGPCRLEEKIKQLRQLDANRQLETIFIDSFQISHHSPRPDSSSQSFDLAYIIYTSGSTGIPKGVMVDHYSAVNLMSYQKRYFHIATSDRIMQFSSLCFDASVEQIFIALSSGASLILVDKHTLLDTHKFENLLARELITHLHAVPLFLNQLNLARCRNLKRVVSGGDICPAELAKKWCHRYDFYNEYGPTETTVTSTEIMIRELDSPLPALPIGKPVGNTGIYLLDKWMNIVPIGVTGEMYIGGDGVARGYLNRPALTAEKFIKPTTGNILFMHHKTTQTPSSTGENPAAENRYPPTMLYRTGDLARRLPDGNVEFLGRIDHQVKVRGFRIELGEIETRLLNHHSIKEAVVIVTGTDGDSTGNKYLCAYIVFHEEKEEPEFANEVSAIKEYLADCLPDYMIPAYFIQLAQIPQTPNGKIDRKSLPAPESTVGSTDYTPPLNDIQETLAEIWASLLAIDKAKIGIDHNFFQLGGHSLKITIMMSRIHKELETKIDMARVFKNPTIRGLAKLIETTAKKRYIRIEPAEKKEYYPLSSAQKRLYFLQKLEGAGTGYNIPLIMKLEGKVEPEKLETTFRQLILRHESLRTTFHMMDDEPVQRIHDRTSFKHNFELNRQYRDRPYNDSPDAYIETFIRPFDLSQAPLLRVGLLKLTGERYLLAVDMHHIISDGMSMGILVQEFTDLYQGIELPGIKLQYKDYARWQNREKLGRDIARQSAYWKKEFAGEIPVLGLPQDYTRPTMQSFTGRRLTFEMNSEIAGSIKALSLETETTPHIMLLAIYSIFIAKISGQEDIVIGTPASGRRHADLEKIIGMFVNTLTPRIFPEGDKTFTGFLTEVKARILDTYENQDYQYEDLVEELNVPRDAGRNPLFNTLFALQNFEIREVDIPDLKLTPYPYERKISKFDLSLFCTETPEQLEFTLEYSTSLFKESTVRRFAGYYKNVVTRLLKQPSVLLKEIEIIPDDEREQILFEFNNTHREYPRNKSIQELFQQEARKHREKQAVVYEGQSLSYHQLDFHADKLALNLKQTGVKPGDIVAVKLETSIQMITAVLAVLKAGCAYLPIAPDYPAERIAYMLADSNAGVMITDGGKIETLNRSSSPVRSSTSRQSHHAYVIYTSGTTGQPKGVLVEHRSVIRLVKNTDFIDLNMEDRIMQTGALEFDASTFEIWGALLNGLTLYLAPREKLLDPHLLNQLIVAYRISIMWLTAPLFNQLVQGDPGIFAGLRCLLTGGDILSPFHINQVRNRLPGLNIINGYGPTENTTFSTTFPIHREYKDNIPIGKPIANSTCYIVDRNNRIQPIGIHGELLVGGDGIASGYMNNPELTAEKFVKADNTWFSDDNHIEEIPEPFILYRTGDLARWLTCGNIQFLGRMDQQVKIRGFRVELEEIESRIVDYPQIKNCVVTVRQGVGERGNGNKYLCAYIVSNIEHIDPDIQGLRSHLEKFLPTYMVPSYFIALDEIPLTPNGKVDRKALPEPGTSPVEDVTAPRDLVETKLVQLWAEILKISPDAIGIDGDFFQLGGHSLTATTMVSRIYKAFNVKISLADVFKTPTIRELADLLKKVVESQYTSIEPVEEKEYYVLSSAQKRLYFLHRLEPGSIVYNMPMVLELKGDVNKNKLESVVGKLLKRHQSLRTSFHMIEETPVQRIHDTVDFKIDNHHAPLKDFVRPFDLSHAPLVRVGLIKKEVEKYILLFDMHHIISDGTSIGIITREFTAFYSGNQFSPAEMKIQYKDFAQWQWHQITTGKLKQQETYWLDLLSGQLPMLELPFDLPRPTIQSFAGDDIKFEIKGPLLDRFRKLIETTGITLYMAALAAMEILLFNYTGQSDMIIGTPISGREHPDLLPLVGLLMDTIVIRNQIYQEQSLTEFIGNIKTVALSSFENQAYPFREVIKQVVKKSDFSRNPIFNIMVEVQNFETSTLELDDLSYSFGTTQMKSAKVDLTFRLEDAKDRIDCKLEYSTALFKQETIRQLSRHLLNLIKQMTDLSGDPSTRITDLHMLDLSEKRRILEQFNTPSQTFTCEQTIDQQLEEQTQRTPNHIAVVCSIQITYKELNKRALHLARELRNNGTTPDTIVAVIIERSLDMVIGLLAILKAGGAYMPIAPDYPAKRIAYMLKDSNAGLLLNGKKDLEPISGWKGKILPIPTGLSSTRYPEEVSPSWQAPVKRSVSDLAYIIYTSGSSGRPKGVCVEHRNLAAYLHAFERQFRLTPLDTVIQQASFTFDVFVEEFYPIQLKGGKLVIPEKNIIYDIQRLSDYITRHHVTMISTSPLMLNELNKSDNVLPIRNYISGGDVLKGQYIDKLVETGDVFNTYGPTESTVCASYYKCTAPVPTDVPLGVPISNYHVYILNAANRLQAVGLAGELCIAGPGVTRGYLNRPALTSEKFRTMQGIGTDGVAVCLYKTGDRGRWLPDGNIEFLGRIDEQVKIRGFRIELGEIDSRIRCYEGIKDVVVLANDGVSAEKQLCAYIVSEGDLHIAQLKDYLLEELPAYMLPSYFIRIEQIPFTSHGKIDRKALPNPAMVDFYTDAEYVPPRNEVETKLVEIWQTILDRNPIGIEEDFFSIGGDSIKAIQISAQMKKENYHLELQDLFKYQCISRLSPHVVPVTTEEELGKSPSGQNPAGIPIDIYRRLEETYPQGIEGIYPLIPVQEGLMFHAYYDESSPMYFARYSFRIRDEISVPVVEKSINKLIERYAVLRTVFIYEDVEGTESPLQVVLSNRQITVKYEDISETGSQWSDSRKERYLEEFKRIIAKQPFDLSRDLLFRVGVLKLGEKDFHLIWTYHHILVDAWSVSVLFLDFMEILDCHLHPKEIQLPQVVPFKNYIHWIMNRDRTESGKYWKNYLKNYDKLASVPKKPSHQKDTGFKAGTVSFVLEPEKTAALNDIAGRNRATLNIVFRTIWAILLGKYSGSEDVVFGNVVSIRPPEIPGIETMVGLFTNILPVRITYQPGITFAQLIRQVQEDSFSCEPHNYYPLVEVQAQSHLKQNLFDNVFTFLNIPGVQELRKTVTHCQEPSGHLDSKLAGSEVFEETGFDMTVYVFPGKVTSMRFVYNTEVYNGDFMEKVPGHVMKIIDSIIENQNGKVDDVEIINEPIVIETSIFDESGPDFDF